MSRSNRRRYRFQKQQRNRKRADRRMRNRIRWSRRQNKHHLLNKCRGGDFSPENILWLKVWKHNEWHRVFKNSDPEYIIKVLQRMMRMKGYKKEAQDE